MASQLESGMKLLTSAIALAAVFAGNAALAQEPSRGSCPAGRSLFGGCINAEIDERARTRSILMVQRRISVSQQLTLPRQDRDFLTAGSRSYIR